MLGLTVGLGLPAGRVPDAVRELVPVIARRGPDGQLSCEDPAWRGRLWMHAAVLHLRGEVMCGQPARDAAGNALCWNGQVFGGSVPVASSESDTARVLARLAKIRAVEVDGDLPHRDEKPCKNGRPRLVRRQRLDEEL